MSDTLQARKETAKDRVAKPITEIPETTLTNQQIEDRLIKARIEMLMSAPFFGNLATRLKLKDATEWCPTAATDGKYFYYNRNFVAALSDGEVVFLMGHEILHCVYDHFDVDRRGDRDPRLWNIANDYVINADLIDDNIGEQMKIVESCFDWKYIGKVADKIYDDLFKQDGGEGRVINVETIEIHGDSKRG